MNRDFPFASIIKTVHFGLCMVLLHQNLHGFAKPNEQKKTDKQNKSESPIKDRFSKNRNLQNFGKSPTRPPVLPFCLLKREVVPSLQSAFLLDTARAKEKSPEKKLQEKE